MHLFLWGILSLTKSYLIAVSLSHFEYFFQVQLSVVYTAKLRTEVEPFVGVLPSSLRCSQHHLHRQIISVICKCHNVAVCTYWRLCALIGWHLGPKECCHHFEDVTIPCGKRLAWKSRGVVVVRGNQNPSYGNDATCYKRHIQEATKC